MNENENKKQNPNDLSVEDQRKALHLRIWVPGFVAAAVFVIFNWFLSREEGYGLVDGVVNFVTFLVVWLILQYMFHRRQFRELR